MLLRRPQESSPEIENPCGLGWLVDAAAPRSYSVGMVADLALPFPRRGGGVVALRRVYILLGRKRKRQPKTEQVGHDPGEFTCPVSPAVGAPQT